MKRTTQSSILSAIGVALAVLPASISARADAVLDWNAIATQALATANPPPPAPPVGFMDMAVVQTAVYDAVQAIEKQYQPYYVAIPGASGSPEAAAAKAAHDTLASIYPEQAGALDTIYHQYLSDHSLAEDDPGVGVGAEAAAAILALRANDGRRPNPLPPAFIGGTDPGEWRPTPSFLPGPPSSFSPMAGPWVGNVPPFTLNSGDQFRANPPPGLNTAKYAKDYNEVKALGALSGSTRTPEQTDMAYFWAGNYTTAWNQAYRDISTAHQLNISENARLLALGALATADATIACWDSKLFYNFWRPVTAIREGANDGNPKTEPDTEWQPLINTPPYPDYTSGANNVAGAYTRILQLFFKTDKVAFSITTTHPLAIQKTRSFDRISDAAAEVVNARILLGIHFRAADVEARKQGRSVAHWAYKNFLKPLHGADDDGDDEDEE